MAFLKLKILQKRKSENINDLKKKNREEFNFSSKIKYDRNDLMEKIINNCTEVKNCNYGIKILKKEEERRFRANLGLKEDNIIITEEYSIT